MKKQSIKRVLSDEEKEAAAIHKTTARVVKHLNDMGVKATHEYQDVISIQRDESWCWNFGTVNEDWGGDLCCDGDPQTSCQLPFRSNHVSDGKDIAAFIYEVTRERANLRLLIDGDQDWTGTAAQFVDENRDNDPQALLTVLRLKEGEEWTYEGGASGKMTFKLLQPMVAITTEAHHTPTPWSIHKSDGEYYIRAETEVGLFTPPFRHQDEQTDADAAFIATACNSHATLIGLIKDFAEHLQMGRNERDTEDKLAMLDGGIAHELIQRAEKYVTMRVQKGAG